MAQFPRFSPSTPSDVSLTSNSRSNAPSTNLLKFQRTSARSVSKSMIARRRSLLLRLVNNVQLLALSSRGQSAIENLVGLTDKMVEYLPDTDVARRVMLALFASPFLF